MTLDGTVKLSIRPGPTSQDVGTSYAKSVLVYPIGFILMPKYGQRFHLPIVRSVNLTVPISSIFMRNGIIKVNTGTTGHDQTIVEIFARGPLPVRGSDRLDLLSSRHARYTCTRFVLGLDPRQTGAWGQAFSD